MFALINVYDSFSGKTKATTAEQIPSSLRSNGPVKKLLTGVRAGWADAGPAP